MQPTVGKLTFFAWTGFHYKWDLNIYWIVVFLITVGLDWDLEWTSCGFAYLRRSAQLVIS